MDHKVTFGGKPVTLVGNRCKVGETAPVFTVTDAGLQPVSSDVFHGKVRIYSIFPSVDTPVCSLQNIRFNREASKLGDDVVVVSLSVDLPFAQKRFCAAEGIDRVHVFSDYRELDFGMKYGFVIDSLRLLARGVVVVDRDDVVRYVEYVPEVTHEPDYEKALAVARELAKYAAGTAEKKRPLSRGPRLSFPEIRGQGFTSDRLRPHMLRAAVTRTARNEAGMSARISGCQQRAGPSA